MITVIFTCFNRREKTRRCIKSLVEGNPGLDFSFVAVDDNSSDGTQQMLEELKKEGIAVTVLNGTGNLFWAGGMRKGIAYAKEYTDSGYYLLVNDDVQFYPGAIEKLLAEAEKIKSAKGLKYLPVMIGPMCETDGSFAYGGIRYQPGAIRYTPVTPADEERSCDTFNMNCLLLPEKAFQDTPNFDPHYVHSLADFDYGLTMKGLGIPVFVGEAYAGLCPNNPAEGTWADRSLGRLERLKKKESVKGAPFLPWFYFLKKNFGVGKALLHGFTPYLRILLGK